MISTHFEFLMYVLGAAFCQQIQMHRIWRLVFSVIDFYDILGQGVILANRRFGDRSWTRRRNSYSNHYTIALHLIAAHLTVRAHSGINFKLFLKVILWTKPRFYYFNPNTDFFTFWYQKGVFFWIETIHCVRVVAKKIVADTWSYFNVHWLSIENCVSITTMFTFVLHRQFEVKFWGAQLGNNSLILRFRSLPRVFN